MKEIEKIIVDGFCDRQNFKKLKSYETYKEVLTLHDKLDDTLTKEQSMMLYRYRDKYCQYNEEYMEEFAGYLIKAIRQLYKK